MWPLWEGERLTLVAQLDLTDPALRDIDLPLPIAGRLLVLWAAVRAPSGQLAAHAGAARVLHVPTPGGASPATRLSVELTLPRVWAAPVQALGLDPVEHDGYLKLRRRIATMQGGRARRRLRPADRLPPRASATRTTTGGLMPVDVRADGLGPRRGRPRHRRRRRRRARAAAGGCWPSSRRARRGRGTSAARPGASTSGSPTRTCGAATSRGSGPSPSPV